MAEKLKISTLTIFAFPNFAIQMIGFAVLTVVPAFYAKHTTVSLAVIGTILTISRLFDAVSDPVIGYLSDKTKTRYGRRKPWMVFSALLGMIAIYFYLQPPEDAGVVYFIVFSFLFYLSWTCYIIPYGAWAVELGRDNTERTKIFFASAIAAASGTILFLSIPLIPFLNFGTTEFGPEAMSVVAWAGIILLPIAIFLAVFFVQEGEVLKADEPKLKDAWMGLVRNRPLARFITIYSLRGMASGFKVALGFLFIDTYLGIGHLFAQVMICFALAQFVAMPLWARLMVKIGKKKSWILSVSVGSVLALGLLFVPKGEAGFIPVLIIYTLAGFFGAIDHMVPHAILGDVIDYDILKTKTNRAASYYSFMALLVKSFGALGSGLSFILLGSFGYSVVEGAINDHVANFGMLFLVAGMPTILNLSSLLLLWNFPIDEAKHTIILKRLRQRQERSSRKSHELSD